MTDDKMREAFEAWARENFMHVERHPSKPTYVNCTAVAECWAAWQACAASRAQEIEALRAARAVAAEQASDEGLWFEATSITEAYLQQALRRIAKAIEGRP